MRKEIQNRIKYLVISVISIILIFFIIEVIKLNGTKGKTETVKVVRTN